MLTGENDTGTPPKLPTKISIRDLRLIASSGASESTKPKTIQARQYYRSIAVKRYALARSNGFCENCGDPAPFLTKSSNPYLEVHHLNRVSDGGADSPEGVAAICPNCHRNIHVGKTGKHINDQLKKTIFDLEQIFAHSHE